MQEEISLIVATSKNNIIGLNNTLPWYSKKDLNYFKRITQENAVIMGRKTYESIGKELPKRLNVVVTSSVIEDVNTAKSIEQAIDICRSKSFKKIFFIGGKSIYEECIQHCDYAYITTFCDLEVNYSESDHVTFMFEFDKSKWLEEKCDIVKEGDSSIKFSRYKRLNNES
jgi:dihydrofolate reductase